MELRSRLVLGCALVLGCGPTGGSGDTESDTESTGDSTSSPVTMTTTMTMTTTPGTDSTGDPDTTAGDSTDEGTTTLEDPSTGTDTSTDDGGSSSSGGTMVEPGDIQALPIVRISEVCESLEGGCCLESACGDYEASLSCFTDRIQDAVEASGDESMLDVVFVVDNTLNTTPMQQALAARAPQIVTALQGLQTSGGADLGADVNVMVTTTDFGNPLCTPFETHPSEQGSPLTTPCTERLERFTSIGGAQVDEGACTDVCPNEAGLADARPYINFNPGGDNIDDVDLVDIDGDGNLDTATSQALACLIPTGLDGCGFEAPLENMLQALNPNAAWNTGGTPFMRDDANLAIVLITNEADCSVMDYSIMEDESLQETNPDTGMPGATSAICWNAGVGCDGADGVYDNCTPEEGGGLQPTSRYTSYFDFLRDNEGKEIVMLVLGGVSLNGADQTVIHDWTDEDLSMADLAAGITAEDNQFNFGIGPGCGGAFP